MKAEVMTRRETFALLLRAAARRTAAPIEFGDGPSGADAPPRDADLTAGIENETQSASNRPL